MITIPISRILDDIYAESALTTILSQSSDRSSILSPDNSAALRRVIVAAAAIIATDLTKRLKSVKFPDNDDIDPQLQFEFDSPTDAETLDKHLITALIFKVFHLLSIQSGNFRKAEAYESIGQSHIDMLTNCLDGRRFSITPYFY